MRWLKFVLPFLDVFESSGQDQPMMEKLTLHLTILSLEASFPANLSIFNILIILVKLCDNCKVLHVLYTIC